ncbi:MAG: beta-mannanase [Planctomycetota bacterium]|nr:beta-mannanase [Planctomycetota bacterium]
MAGMGYTLGEDGYFRRGGKRFVPVGANYWPASCGVELWPAWPADEIRHDLDVLRGLGLNCIRFFLRWQDFEPEAGRYDEPSFARLGEFLGWCGERGIAAHPSLFVGWMSGGIFWPKWREERNVFSDPFMVERGVAFARRAAEAIAPHHDHVLAIDQGNELCCLPDSHAAPPAAVIRWCGAVNRAVRETYPQAIIISGNEQNQITGDTGWRFGQQPGCDLLSMHAYPVQAWHSISFDGLGDPLARSLLPFYVRCARAFAPVMAQEFGTIVTFGARQQDGYLRAMLPACWQAGANGFLWWCLKDIAARVHPYLKCGFESTLGLVDAAGKVKPGLEYYLEFALSLPDRPAPAPEPAAIGIYWPRKYYPRDDQENPGNDPHQLSRRLVIANHLLNQLGHTVRVVRGDEPLPADLTTLVVPGALLTVDEAEALDSWVRAGGRLVWHGPDPVNWGHAYCRLLGARPVDYRSPRAVEVQAFGARWPLAAFPRNMRVELEPATARVVSRDGDGLPVVLVHRVERGSVAYALPMVENVPAAADRRDERDRWTAWLAGMLALVAEDAG